MAKQILERPDSVAEKMPRDGALTFGDLDGRLDVLRVACRKCDRSGQYPVTKLIERYAPDTKLPDWRDHITGDCPRRANDRVSIMDLCGAHFPDLIGVFSAST